MKKLLIVFDCEDYILDDLKEFDITKIKLYPNTYKVHSYTFEVEDCVQDGFKLLEMPQKKNIYLAEKRSDGRHTLFSKPYVQGFNDCIDEILGEQE